MLAARGAFVGVHYNRGRDAAETILLGIQQRGGKV